ncbi:hypothetical protein SEA_SMEADLEY_40 [Mycobacterium phage Smeadley]|uniref:Uncharacterized protein n=1 Tax=Mycobacterium phage Smeadley TaxID=1673873 RepID=A0A0H4TH52_9CAUD|nr:hypothetical protein AVT31_gp067 [Mycobacterium phage Smeadley]AKQ07608.1 hypothetical protein SEA_SMEADLEY_40 [Mycobacterium phage Smeadley]QBI96634.1 hypothetical protein SEA_EXPELLIARMUS_39 [Mycobacterium phage Expelliarmus]
MKTFTSAKELLEARISGLDGEISWRKQILRDREEQIQSDRTELNNMVAERSALAKAVRQL